MKINLLPENIYIHLVTYENKGIHFSGHWNLKGKTLKCTIDYPLAHPCVFDIVIPNKAYQPVTYIIDSIVNKYREIYKEENETLTELSESATVLNRGRSNGKWGIWGHVLSDLVLARITLDTETNEIDLGVDS